MKKCQINLYENVKFNFLQFLFLSPLFNCQAGIRIREGKKSERKKNNNIN